MKRTEVTSNAPARKARNYATQGTELFSLGERLRKASALAYETNRLIAKVGKVDAAKARRIESEAVAGIVAYVEGECGV